MRVLAEKDAAVFAARSEEIAYLANVLVAGASIDGRRYRPAEAVREAVEVVQSGARTRVRQFGRIDGAFNNAAAGTGVLSTIVDQTSEDFDAALADNLRSVWLCMRAEVRAMLKQTPPGGAIVNMSSVNGLGAAPEGALYSAAKAGVVSLTKGVAIDHARQHVRANAIATFVIDGGMTAFAR
jgi:NAD(P)-dependent dehydrogenase (short-subunit alcohol dehydrogenase family)